VPIRYMTLWAAPCTGGYDRVFPKDAILVIANDPPEDTPAVCASKTFIAPGKVWMKEEVRCRKTETSLGT
jgi:hypothetical protein